MEPVRRARIAFCLLLAVLSTFCAEVLSGSAPWAFVTPWGLGIILPLYGLHVIILGTLLVRAGRTDLWTLGTAGMLFGLYEAWITKVLFDPPWGDPWPFFGLALPETVGISFSWHVVMSFALPLLVAIEFVAPVRDPASPSRFDGRLARRVLGFILISAGLFPSLANPKIFPLQAILSVAIGLTAVALSIWWYRREAVKAGDPPLDQLLPGPVSLRKLVGILALFYLVSLPAMRPEAIPGAAAILFMLVVDALMIGALAFRLGLLGPARPTSAVPALPVAISTSSVVAGVPAPVPAAAAPSPTPALDGAQPDGGPLRGTRFRWALFGQAAGVLLAAVTLGAILSTLAPSVHFVAAVLVMATNMALGCYVAFKVVRSTAMEYAARRAATRSVAPSPAVA